MSKGAALITGASSGIGRDIARELAGRGHDLILVARRRERLEELAGELGDTGVSCHVLPCDLADREALNGLMARADGWLKERQQPLTLLVNNAGSGVWDRFENQDRLTSQRDIDLNVTAPTTLCHDFVARAREHGKPGHILNIASLAGLLPTPRFAVYSATKSYVVRLTEVLAHELRGTPISVTASCPGGVLTEFMDHAGQTLKGETGMMRSEDVARLSVNAMFAGRTIYIPGTLNRASALTRFLPRAVRTRLVEKGMLITVEE